MFRIGPGSGEFWIQFYMNPVDEPMKYIVFRFQSLAKSSLVELGRRDSGGYSSLLPFFPIRKKHLNRQ